MFLRNAWYVAGWTSEFSAQRAAARVIWMGNPTLADPGLIPDAGMLDDSWRTGTSTH